MTFDNDPNNAGGAKPQLLSSRPELGISAKSHPNAQDTNDRILSKLKSEPAAKSANASLAVRPGIKFFSLLGISIIAAFSGYLYLSNPGLSAPTSDAQDHSLATPAPVVPVVLAAAPPVVSTPAPAPTTTSEAAQIVTAAVPALATLPASPPAPAPDTLTKALEDKVAPPVAAIQKALEAKPPAVAQAKPTTSHLSVTSTSASPAKTAPIKTKPIKTKPVAPSADKDVSLLAALIAHSETVPVPAHTPAVAIAAKAKASEGEARKNSAATEEAAK